MEEAEVKLLRTGVERFASRPSMVQSESCIEAGAFRLRPILMTTMACSPARLPWRWAATKGAQFRAPLGVSVIGGVITSTLLTLIAIPTFYEILDQARERMLGFSSRVFGREEMKQLSHAVSGARRVGP